MPAGDDFNRRISSIVAGGYAHEQLLEDEFGARLYTKSCQVSSLHSHGRQFKISKPCDFCGGKAQNRPLMPDDKI
jgi:hypothetical protein